MKSIHLKCEDHQYVVPVGSLDYESGYWTIPVMDAQAILNGMIYLHQKKNEPSYFGGLVKSYRIEENIESEYVGRIVFLLESRKEGKGKKWRGKKHRMSYYSGIVDESE